MAIYAKILDFTHFNENSIIETPISKSVSRVEADNPGKENEKIFIGYKFDTDSFDLDSAKKYLDDKNIQYESIEESKDYKKDKEEKSNYKDKGKDKVENAKEIEEDTEEEVEDSSEMKSKKKSKKEEDKDERYEITDVPIMEVGTWNNTNFTHEDLDSMVESFTDLKTELKPYLKLGHNEDQALLKSDGLPSAGWITNLKRKGKTLFADIKNIPKSVYELIKRQAYGRFSSEVYFNAEFKSKKYNRVLKAVALLGADTPAVTSMADLLNIYSEPVKYEKLLLCNNQENGEDMEDLKEKFSSLEKENELLKNKISEIEESRENEKINSFINKSISEGKILPAQKDAFFSLMKGRELKNFSMVNGDTVEEKQVSNFELVQSIIDNSPVKVDFSTQSTSYKKTEESKDETLEKEIKEYMENNEGINYSEAFRIVQRSHE